MASAVIDRLFDQHHDFVMLVSSHDWSVTYANDTAHEVLPQELEPGADIRSVLSERAFNQSPLAEVLRLGQGCITRRLAEGLIEVASIIYTDPTRKANEALVTQHQVDSIDLAVAAHELVATRAVAALELQQAITLHEIAKDAIAQTGEHLARLLETVLHSAHSATRPDAEVTQMPDRQVDRRPA